MGYTNYWHQHNDITDQNWKVIMTEYKDYVLEVCGDEIKDESTADSIIFQGDCETFKFDRYAKVEKDYPEQDNHYIFVKLDKLNTIFMFGICLCSLIRFVLA